MCLLLQDLVQSCLRGEGGIVEDMCYERRRAEACVDSSIDMYNNDVGQESAQKFMKQTGDLKAATLYFAS